MIKAVLFDADGTLYIVNKENAYKEFFRFLSEKTGVDVKEIEEKWKGLKREILNSEDRNDPKKRRREYLTKKLLTYFNLDDETVNILVHDSLDLFWHVVLSDTVSLPHVEEVVADLSKGYILVVCSNEFRDILEKKLNKVFGDWRKYFKFLITPDETETMKPSKRFYEIALERLSIKPDEAVMVGDSWEEDLEPAKNLGMKTILLNNEKEGEPDFWLKSLKNLIGIVRSLT